MSRSIRNDMSAGPWRLEEEQVLLGGIRLMLKINKLKIIIMIAITLNLLTGCEKSNMYEMDATEKYFAENYPELEITWINTNKTDFNIKYENIGNNDRYIVNYVKDGLYYPLVINKKSGEVIKTADYDAIYDYTEGRAAVYYCDTKLLKDGGYTVDNYRSGFIDVDGNEVIPTIYERTHPFSEGLAEVKRGDKFGYIDYDGNIVLPLEYTSSQPFRGGYAAVSKIDGNGIEIYGIIDKKGNFNEVKGAKSISAFNNGVARAWRDFGEIYIDVNGNEVKDTEAVNDEIAKRYDKVSNYKEGRAVVVDEVWPEWQNKYGVVDEEGNIVIPVEYSYIYDYCEGMTSANLNRGKNAYFDIEGNKVTSFRYDITRDFHEGVAVVGIGSYKDGSLAEGVINKHGNEIIPLIFDFISDFYGGYALVGYENGNDKYVSTSKQIGILKLPKDFYKDDGSTEFISVILNGSKIFFDQDPIIDSDRVLVPLRAIMEAIGAELTWNESGEVTVLKSGTKIELKIGEKQAFLNGEKCDLDVPAKIISGRTLVPVRFIAQCLNYDIEWNQDTQTINISQ